MSDTKELLTAIAEALLDSRLISEQHRVRIALILADYGKAKTTRFTAPTEEEVENFFKEKGVMFPAEHAKKFYYFYGSKNWMVGKNKMKNWQLAASRWAMDLPKVNELTSKIVIV